MNEDILAYNQSQSPENRAICDLLADIIDGGLPKSESKIWHAHPVWFLDGNPIVGYHKLKNCVRLLFWSGQSFDEPGLAKEGSFKAAEARYTEVDQVNTKDLKRWLRKAKEIQWDYKNIVKRKGKLVRLKQCGLLKKMMDRALGPCFFWGTDWGYAAIWYALTLPSPGGRGSNTGFELADGNLSVRKRSAPRSLRSRVRAIRAYPSQR